MFLCVFVLLSKGVIRVYLQEAENLVQMDNFLGKSDPYALLRVGQVQFRSKTVHRNLNPIWNEMFEVTILLELLLAISWNAVLSPCSEF